MPASTPMQRTDLSSAQSKWVHEALEPVHSSSAGLLFDQAQRHMRRDVGFRPSVLYLARVRAGHRG
eukprot:9279636-Pyramimonas_sp.AAC.1